jgi:hypothetical protein
MTRPEAERERFEKWVIEETSFTPHCLRRVAELYVNRAVEGLWEAWQAGHSTPQPPRINERFVSEEEMKQVVAKQMADSCTPQPPAPEPANRWPKCKWCCTDLERFVRESGKCPACGAIDFMEPPAAPEQPLAPELAPNKCPSCGSKRKDSVGYMPSKEFGRIPCLVTWHNRDAAAPEPDEPVLNDNACDCCRERGCNWGCNCSSAAPEQPVSAASAEIIAVLNNSVTELREENIRLRHEDRRAEGGE